MTIKQRILIIGKRGGILHWPEHILDAQDELTDIELDVFYFNHHSTIQKIAYKLFKAFKGELSLRKFIAQQLKNKINTFKPDTIIFVDVFYFWPSIQLVLDQFKGKIKLAQWIGDFIEPRMSETNKQIDHFFCTDEGVLIQAQDLGLKASYLPLAFNPKIFYEDKSILKKDRPILFIGAFSKNRLEALIEINEPLLVVGKGWGVLNKPNIKVIDKNISINTVADLYRNHQYALNIPNTNNISGNLNMRVFEASACGCEVLESKGKVRINTTSHSIQIDDLQLQTYSIRILKILKITDRI